MHGKWMNKVTEHKTKVDWARFLRDIAERCQDAERLRQTIFEFSTTNRRAAWQWM